MLSQAVNDDRIAKNACRVAGGGTERHSEQRFISLTELYEVAAVVPDHCRALVLTAGLAGLRQGELFALRRADVDLLHATITVRRKRVRLACGDVIEDDPKSAAGRRTVAIPRPLVDELNRHLSTYSSPGPDAYVFASPNGTPFDRHNFRMCVWLPAVRRVGYDDLRFHDLRHVAGTLAARTGATTKEIMSRLGHASPERGDGVSARNRGPRPSDRRPAGRDDRRGGLGDGRGDRRSPANGIRCLSRFSSVWHPRPRRSHDRKLAMVPIATT